MPPHYLDVMENLFNNFNQNFLDKARIAVIGGEVRNNLAKKNNWYFPDLTSHPHLDVLVALTGPNKQSVLKDIFRFFRAHRLTDLCHVAKVSGRKVEFIGVIDDGILFTNNLIPVPARPDLSIERFGYYNDWTKYDESGRGFDDFSAQTLSLLNDNLFLNKYLKILSLKFQTDFTFDSQTATVISQFENSLIFSKKKSNQVFAYNRQLFKEYGVYDKADPYKIGIHVALLYLRARSASEVTSYIEKHDRLKHYLRQASVDYHAFELQINSGI